MLAFFAYWFGAARFDMNGDGEFDAADVQRMINNVGLYLRFSFSRPIPRRRRLQERLRKQAMKAEKELEAKRERQQVHAAYMQEIREKADEAREGRGGLRRPAISARAALAMAGERAAYGIDVVLNKGGHVIDANVEGECVESTIKDNLRQYWPWFTISQVCVCFGLWLGYVLQTNQYVILAQHVAVDESLLIGNFSGIPSYACQIECSRLGDACWGVSALEGPFTQCKLLSAAPKDISSGGCNEGVWNWVLYEKQPRTFASLLGTMGGLETAYPGLTAMQSYSYCDEGFKTSMLWRVLSYQFTHGGLGHIGSNCLMLIMLGVPLEGFHGTGLTALMYTIGVVGGGLALIVLDPDTKAYGASGGGYALLGMHLADLILNWKQKKFRYPVVLMLAAIIGVETIGYISSLQGDASNIAHSAHAGGLVSGLITGMMFTRNIEKKCWERVLQVVALLVGAGLVCFSFAWWFSNPLPGVRNLWNDAEGPLCWMGQVCTNDEGTGCDFSEGWQCVVCSTRECVENWYKDELSFCVTRGGQAVCDGNFADIVHNCQNC
jgi:membrane associated rhomboid family serine protease